MKIGLYAGTFDPIHNGHINFAINAVKNTDLDKVVIVAEKNPYRKKPFAGWDHRQAMIENSTEDIKKADHDYQFANKLAYQHTMQDMLTVARSHYGKENEFWFLVGSDIFEHIHRWEDITKQHEYGGFVVALRDNHTKSWLDSKILELKKDGFQAKIILVQNEHPHISSKKIRDQITNNITPDNLPKKVLDYINEHNLYK